MKNAENIRLSNNIYIKLFVIQTRKKDGTADKMLQGAKERSEGTLAGERQE